MDQIQHATTREARWSVRVYYEDTDAGGVVYHANYLRFCERARTEWLRVLGIEQRQLIAERNVAFAVTRIEADYLRGAELDDDLLVVSTVDSFSGASINFRQRVLRGNDCLFEAMVRITCIDVRRRRATRIPDPLRKILEGTA